MRLCVATIRSSCTAIADGGANRTVCAFHANSWSKKTGEAKQLELIGWEISPTNRLDWWIFATRLLSTERTLFCFLPLSMTSEIVFDSTTLTSFAANYNKNGAPESAAVEPEPFEAEQ